MGVKQGSAMVEAAIVFPIAIAVTVLLVLLAVDLYSEASGAAAAHLCSMTDRDEVSTVRWLRAGGVL